MLRSLVLLLSLLSTTLVVEAGIVDGFKKDVPLLEELPELRSKIKYSRNKQGRRGRRGQESEVEGGGHIGFYQKASKKSKKSSGGSGSSDSSDDGNTGGGSNPSYPGPGGGGGGSTGGNDSPYHPTAGTVIDMIIILDDFAYSSDQIEIGTTFAFNGRAATVSEVIGTAAGSCVVSSDQNIDVTMCDFYLYLYGDYGEGPVALTGGSDSDAGYMQITAGGGDFPNQGYAQLAFDPAGNPMIYTLLTFQ